jgi:hypothetical protein
MGFRDKHMSGGKLTSILRQTIWYLPTIFFLSGALWAEPIAVHYVEGTIHGFLVLRNADGETLASGDLVQIAHGDRISTKLVYHFKDGSIDDETTVYSQRGVFRLLKDHHIQKGPSFPHPLDLSLDTSTSQVIVRSVNKDGKEEVATQHMELPADLANGLVSTLIKNIPRDVSETKVSMLVASPKPRLVKLAISHDGSESASVAGSRLEATRYLVKIEIGGVSGVVAPLVGKQPADTRVWILGGEAPVFLKSLGPTQAEGPVWSSELMAPTWASTSSKEH